MGIFRYDSPGLTVRRPCGRGESLCARGGRIDAEAFFRETASGGEREWHGMARRARAYSGSAGVVREVYVNPSISPSLPSVLQSSCRASNQRRTSRLLPTISMRLRWPLLPSKLIPTCQLLRAPTATRRRPAPEQVSILNKLRHVMSSGASLSTPRPAAAAAADDDGGYRPGIRGM